MFKFNTIQSVQGVPSRNWTVAEGNDKPLGVLLLALILILYVSGCGLTTAASNKPKPPSNVSSLTISTSTLPQAVVQSNYQASMTASGGKQPYTWSVVSGSLPPGLHLTSSTGTISGMPSQTGTFSFSAQVQDSSSPLKTVTRPAAVTVSSTASPLQIATNSLPAGKVGTAYQATLTASGGTQPYIWSAPSGSLPLGLTLNSSTGLLSGSPTQQGTFNFTIHAVDSTGQSATASVSIAIAASTTTPSALAISTTSLPSGQVSRPYSATLTATGGQAPYTWGMTSSSGPLPSGLTLSATTGTISGTPTTSASYTFTIQVSDSSSTQQLATKTYTVSTAGVTLDQYGGREDIQCASATGYFHVEKINNKWWYCTPLGNGFFMESVDEVTPGLEPAYKNVAIQKYGDSGPTWSEQTNRRLQSWGFNTLNVGNSLYSDATYLDNSYPLDANGLHSHPTKLPFILSVRPALNSMKNVTVTTISNGNLQFLSEPVKNILNGVSPYYTGYVPPKGEADYFDPKFQTWLHDDMTEDTWWGKFESVPYNSYVLGITGDDGDELFGFGAGDAFATTPAGHNSPNLAWIIATMSPVQTAIHGFYQAIYSDETLYSKKAWHDALVTKYGTISALNAAWGSNYTTFDSSGTSVAAEVVGTGNGSVLGFTHTLAHLTPSKYSVEVLVNGAAVAGDLGNGTLYGPTLASGTITYATGLLTLNFASGSAPPVGASITVSYIANGWGFGTGLMDEDGRPADQAWLGSDYIFLANTNPNVATDLNAFLYSYAAQYIGTVRTEVKAVFPNFIYFGANGVGSWGTPARAAILQAVGAFTDVIIADGRIATSQPMTDYMRQNDNDKPFLVSWYLSANPDSSWSGRSSTGTDFPTQAARGQAWYNNVTTALATTTSSGERMVIGVDWWQFIDNSGEKTNYGLVSLHDNAYDGHEDVSSTVTCSAPLQAYSCGGEPGNYGDAISQVKAANIYWLTH